MSLNLTYPTPFNGAVIIGDTTKNNYGGSADVPPQLTTVVIDGATLPIAAVLELRSTDGAFVIPRMSSEERITLSPVVNGSIVYDTDLQSVMFYANGAWGQASSASNGVLFSANMPAAVVLNPSETSQTLYTTTVLDPTNSYNAPGATFTAPVGGDYKLTYTMVVSATGPGVFRLDTTFYINNVITEYTITQNNEITGETDDTVITNTVLVSVGAGETVFMSVANNGNVDCSITGGWFDGFLVPSMSGAAGGNQLTWNVQPASGAAVKNNGYYTTGAGLVVMTLPAVAAVGDTFRFSSGSNGNFQIAQNAGQLIRHGNQLTTVGVVGFLQSQTIGDSIELVCMQTNSLFQVVSSNGGNVTLN